MALTELERRIVAKCEFSWFLGSSLPTPETLREEFNLTQKGLNEILQSEGFKKSCEARGIPVIEGRTLTPDQLTAINTILNFADPRSEKKKLQDMQISQATWNGWRQSKAFKEYFLQRTEGILGDSIPDIHMALVDRARNGDLGAIKMVYEMTGRYKQDQGELNPRALVEKVFEIITQVVTDPAQLTAISDRFALLIGVDPSGTITNEPPVAGVVVQSQLEGL